MDAEARREELNGITERIIGAAYTVLRELGSGFLEKVYENALAHELRKAGLRVEQQAPVPVVYDGVNVGTYFADIMVNASVIVEIKAARALEDIHQAQTLNYLKATKLSVGLILNFGKPKLEIKRFEYNF